MKIYLIPGLGADKRMYLSQLSVLKNAEVLEHLPAIKNETLPKYAGRVASLIDSSSPFILLGTSLGGMIALEISRIIRPEKIILISTIKSRKEMPLFIRSMKYLRLHRLLKGGHFKRMNKLMVKRLDSRRDSSVAEIIKAMTDDVPAEFIEWAIDAVVNWKGMEFIDSDYVHIHGTNDKLFPISKIKNSIAVPNGSHVMNMTMSGQVNHIILQHLNL